MLTMLPEDGEELLQKLSSEMGLPDFMSDVTMDMDPYTVGDEDVSDSTASSETELGPITNGCHTNGGFASHYNTDAAADVDAVAADLLSSGVLDQIMVEELSNGSNPDFTENETKPIIANGFNHTIFKPLQHQGKCKMYSKNI